MVANLDDMRRLNVPTYYKAEGNVTLTDATMPSGSSKGVLLTSTNVLQFLGDYYCPANKRFLFTLPSFAFPRVSLFLPIAYYGATTAAYDVTIVRIGPDGVVNLITAPTERYRLYFTGMCISLARGYYG